MENNRILLCGQAAVGKSTYVRNVNGVEVNTINGQVLPYPHIYVLNYTPDNFDNFDIVMYANKNGIFTLKDVMIR